MPPILVLSNKRNEGCAGDLVSSHITYNTFFVPFSISIITEYIFYAIGWCLATNNIRIPDLQRNQPNTSSAVEDDYAYLFLRLLVKPADVLGRYGGSGDQPKKMGSLSKKGE
jgi:hypothetical protein